MAIVVQRMREEQLPSVAALIKGGIYEEEEGKGEFIEQWLRGYGTFPYVQFFVVLKDGEIIGTIIWNVLDFKRDEALGKIEFSLELSTIAVVEEHRKRGIGLALIQQSLLMIQDSDALRDMKLAVITVATEQTNEEAVSLYRNLGPFHEALIPQYWDGGDEKDVITFYFRPESML